MESHKTFRFICLIFVFIWSCSTDKKPTEQDLESTLDNSVFNEGFIKNIEKYKVLKHFIEQHIETLLTFRDSTSYVTVNNPDKPVYRELRPENCYFFNKSDGKFDSAYIPKFLYFKFDSLLNIIESKNLVGFEVCHDKSIKFLVKVEGKEGWIFTEHSLVANTKLKIPKNHEKYKDSMLNNEFVYRINVYEDFGD